jgi:hypothetical protein
MQRNTIALALGLLCGLDKSHILKHRLAAMRILLACVGALGVATQARA